GPFKRISLILIIVSPTAVREDKASAPALKSFFRSELIHCPADRNFVCPVKLDEIGSFQEKRLHFLPEEGYGIRGIKVDVSAECSGMVLPHTEHGGGGPLVVPGIAVKVHPGKHSFLQKLTE